MSDKNEKTKTVIAILGIPLLLVSIMIFGFTAAIENQGPTDDKTEEDKSQNGKSHIVVNFIIMLFMLFIVLPFFSKRNESINKFHLLMNGILNQVLVIEAIPIVIIAYMIFSGFFNKTKK